MVFCVLVSEPSTSSAAGRSHTEASARPGRWADEDSEDEDPGLASFKVRSVTTTGATEHVTKVRQISGLRLFRASDASVHGRGLEETLPLQRTSSLLLLAVPHEVSLVTLEAFFGDYLAEVEELLVLLRMPCGRKTAGDFYSVVVNCRSQSGADRVYQVNHGRFFSQGGNSQRVSGGPCCYLIFLESLSYVPVSVTAAVGAAAQRDSHLLDLPEAIPQVAYELPSCPFCLERIDVSGTGMVTHNNGWLSAMPGGSAPSENCCLACETITRARSSGEQSEVCAVCGKREGLWVCLMCGYTGCGRYALAHSKDHGLERGHRFCMELATGRIWDYSGDVFVHRRLVQMAAASGERFFDLSLPMPADGVVGPASPGRSDATSKQRAMQEDSLAAELDAILASQLDHQRSLYEAKLHELTEGQRLGLDCERRIAERAQRSEEEMAAELAEAERSHRQAEKQALAAEKERDQVQEKLHFVKDLNQSMLANRRDMASAGKVTAEVVPDEESGMVKRLRKQVEELMAEMSAAEEGVT